MLRKCVIALSVLALLIGSANQSKAIVIVTPPAAAGAGAVTTGAWVAGGFVGAIAVLCLYDLWLKVDGQKNWDGTAKTARKVRVHDITVTKKSDKASP
jgi:hypothetical protein